ncbi:Cys-Cys-COOH (seleno)protein SaoC [Phosphitispora sp. TUW77]|uniref:Cys-Cys-COOH (seleno)protein SaoC n=1 Tax=Phosphitispora sp. TUW77 TaxID=3152361 RepID=UPI003AB7CB19
MSVRIIQALILVLFLCFNSLGCSGQDSFKAKEGRNQQVENKQDISSDPMAKYFLTANPGSELLKTARADLNGDGRADLVVIYRVAQDKNMMRVVLNLNRALTLTNEVLAPRENQSIQFRDIDKKPPMEFIVQGSKGAKMGYAIYRIEGKILKDIFGEGMGDCC